MGGAGMGVGCPQAVTMEAITMSEKIVSNNLLDFISFILLIYQIIFQISEVSERNKGQVVFSSMTSFLRTPLTRGTMGWGVNH